MDKEWQQKCETFYSHHFPYVAKILPYGSLFYYNSDINYLYYVHPAGIPIVISLYHQINWLKYHKDTVVGATYNYVQHLDRYTGYMVDDKEHRQLCDLNLEQRYELNKFFSEFYRKKILHEKDAISEYKVDISECQYIQPVPKRISTRLFNPHGVYDTHDKIVILDTANMYLGELGYFYDFSIKNDKQSRMLNMIQHIVDSKGWATTDHVSLMLAAYNLELQHNGDPDQAEHLIWS